MRSVLIASTLCAVPAAAQEGRPAPSTGDVVVQGRRDADEPDAANRRPSVFVGSRLARPSSQNNPYLAMRTSANGLTPDSGVDAFQNDSRLAWRSCKADGATLSKHAACALAAVQKRMEAGELGRAQTLALDLARRPDLTAEDRYVTQAFLYRIAAAIPDSASKRAALAAMVDSGMMGVGDEAAAVRALAAMAVKLDDRREALARYEQAGRLDADDAQSRINAAALLQRQGEGERARAHVRAAIDIARRSGREAPPEWLENAR